MRPGLQPGHAADLAWTVAPHQTIHLGATEPGGGAVVFSTPNMIDLMEHAARHALLPYLEPDEESVGVRVHVEHLAATPVAARVRAEARVTAVDGRTIDFDITARDEAEPIGRGTHRRAVIRTPSFTKRLAEKTQRLPSGVLLPMRIQPNEGDLPPLDAMRFEADGPVATLTLDRPRQLNAVNIAMTDDFEKVIAYLAGHAESIRVVILTGAGRAFCAGDDVKEVATLSTEAATELSYRQAEMYLALERLPQPVIAAVNGHALGGGCVAAYSCDFRIAVPNADFGMPEILLGWAPGYGVAQLAALIGKARALELCLTGNLITARKAHQWGLVHQVVPANRLIPAARALADALLATPPIALAETKRLIHADDPPHTKTTYLADTAAYIRCLQTADAAEGIAAFTQKRKPTFRGR